MRLIRNISLILILLLGTTIIAFGYEASEKIREMLPDKYYIVFRQKADIDDDSIEEQWVAAMKSNEDGISSTKILLYEDFGNDILLEWESPEIKGSYGDMNSFSADDKRYLWVEIHRYDLGLFQMWIFNWDGENRYLVYPNNLHADNILTSQEMFARNYYDNDGEFEFCAYFKEDNGTRKKIYAIRNGIPVLKDEKFLEKENIIIKNTNTPSIKDKYPLILKLVEKRYPNYSLEYVELLDLDIYIVRIVEKTINKFIVLHKKENNVEFLYEIDSKYANYDLFGSHDVTHDGYEEIFLSYRAYYEEITDLYIISIRPDGFKLLTPVDENGVSLVKQYGPEYFKDINNDGYDDLIVSSNFQRETIWLWNENEQIYEYYTER